MSRQLGQPVGQGVIGVGRRDMVAVTDSGALPLGVIVNPHAHLRHRVVGSLPGGLRLLGTVELKL